MSRARYVPTIDDLQVKLCYICRDEDTSDSPTNPARQWVHPCKCTLIAHEDCLLEWIRASESNPDRSTNNFLKCPQCGSKYELESKDPLALSIMDLGSELLNVLGHGSAIATIGAVVFSFGSGLYVLCAGYGAYAVEKLIGREMFDYYLTDDPANWQMSYFFDLPLVPLSLILSKTSRFRHILPITTILMLLPMSGPATPPPFSPPSFTWLIRSKQDIGRNLLSIRDLFFGLPPSPFAFNLCLPILRALYRRNFHRLRRYVLGEDAEKEEELRRRLRGVIRENFRMEMRIEDDVQEIGAPEDQAVPQPVPVRNNDVQIGDDNNVRLVLDEPEAGAVPGQRQPANGQPAPLIGGAAAQNQNQDRGPVRIRMSAAALGNMIGGALLIPPIASFMGSLLLRLALPRGVSHTTDAASLWYDIQTRRYKIPSNPWSARYLLMRFLAIRPPGLASSAPPISSLFTGINDRRGWTQVTETLKVVMHLILIGGPAWTCADPVWWRNTVGLSLFYVAKDCLSLWYSWLSQREIKSRRLKSQSFIGIDPAELDLKPEVRERIAAESV